VADFVKTIKESISFSEEFSLWDRQGAEDNITLTETFEPERQELDESVNLTERFEGERQELDENLTINDGIGEGQHVDDSMTLTEDVDLGVAPTGSDIITLNDSGHETSEDTVNYTDGITLNDTRETIPTVQIIYPSGGMQWVYNMPITLQGIANNPSGVPLPSGQVEWWSDIDGFLEYGQNTSHANWSIGHHKITLIGIISPGVTARYVIEIDALPNTPPQRVSEIEVE